MSLKVRFSVTNITKIRENPNMYSMSTVDLNDCCILAKMAQSNFSYTVITVYQLTYDKGKKWTGGFSCKLTINAYHDNARKSSSIITEFSHLVRKKLFSNYKINILYTLPFGFSFRLFRFPIQKILTLSNVI